MFRAPLAVTLLMACANASACQIIVQATLTFAEGSADLDRDQIVKMAQWIDFANAQFAKYKNAYVEAGASAGNTVDASRLAQRRAEATARALQTLLPFELPVEKTSQAYRERRVALDGGTDYATIQLNPDFNSPDVPACPPAPMSNVKR